MQFEHPLIPATLIKRYKRFLADVELPDGTVITAHCPNPGSMLGLNNPGSKVWISDSNNPKRKLRHSLEIVEAGGALVGINTNYANTLAREALEMGMIRDVSKEMSFTPEQPYGENSRIDFLAKSSAGVDLYIEVKSVTLSRQRHLAEFPDSVTKRGTKHLNELINVMKAGNRAMLLYLVQRKDAKRFRPAFDIDRQYADAFKNAVSAGLETHAIVCDISLSAIIPKTLIPIEI